MVFIDRELDATRSQRLLLESVTEEMTRVKTSGQALSMLGVLAAFSLWPSGMRRILDWHPCPTTTVLSNVGRIFDRCPHDGSDLRTDVGDAVLESIDFLPPIRRGVPAAFGVNTYADELSCCMHYDPRRLTTEEATQLHEDVTQAMRRHVESGVEMVRCG
jgi:hypothetical protein